VSGRETALDALRPFLAHTPAGPVPEEQIGQVERLLANAWDELAGGDDEAMAGHKVLGRTEDLTWEPPELSFAIERHGAIVRGGTRAEMHGWGVDVQTGEAQRWASRSHYRQVYRRAPAVRVEPVADGVVRAVADARPHPAVAWVTPARVRVTPARIDALGLGDGFKATVAGRRRRFVAALVARLGPLGWSRVPSGRSLRFDRTAAPA
jgi:hypothetical protein